MNKDKMTDVISFGSVNIDYVAKVPHLPVKGETVQATDFTTYPGGKGANQAVAAARMGGKVSMVGCIGDDEEGEIFKETFQKEGIDLEGLKISPDKHTGVSLIGLDENGNNTIITYPGANKDITLEDIKSIDDLFHSARITSLHWDIKKEVGEAFIKSANSHGLKIVLNLAPIRPINTEVLGLIDVLIVNEIEAKMLTDVEVMDLKSARKAADNLKVFGLERIIITMGGKGTVVFNRNEENYLPVYEVEVEDTTAAGDTFVGAFTQFYLERPLLESVKLASKAASLSVTRQGAINSIPRLEELNNFTGGVGT